MGELTLTQKIEENTRKNLNRIRKSTMNGERAPGLHVSDIVAFNLCKRKAMFAANGIAEPPHSQDQLEILAAGNIVHDVFDRTIKEEQGITLSGEKKIKADIKIDEIGNQLTIHGEVDSIGKVGDTKFILDWKTWNSYGGGRKQDQVKEDHLLQMSLYALIIEESTGERIDYGVISYLDFAKRLGKEENHAVKLLSSIQAFKVVKEYYEAIEALYSTKKLPPIERKTDPKKNPYPIWLCHWASGGCPYVKLCLKDSPNEGEGKIAKIDELAFDPLQGVNTMMGAYSLLQALKKLKSEDKKKDAK